MTRTHYGHDVMIASAPIRRLGVDEGRAILRFGEAPRRSGEWAGRRLLWLGDQPAFELSYWCGTCPALFQRQHGANRTLSVSECEDILAAGLDTPADTVLAQFGSLLPAGDYLPLLLRVTPDLVRPAGPGDYFADESVATWGVDGFWGLPPYPRTPYYRTFETPVAADAHLYEFVVPMVPPTWNDPGRTAHYEELLRTSDRPTAVAVSTLDICGPAIVGDGRDRYTHWALTHFLLDGHHKLHAAAAAGRPVRLLSLLSVAGGLADAEALDRIVAIRSGARERRR